MQSFAHLHKTDQKIRKDIHHNKAFYCMCVRADTANASWTHPNMYDQTFAHVDIVYQRDGRYRYCYPGDPSSLWHIETTWCLRFWVGGRTFLFWVLYCGTSWDRHIVGFVKLVCCHVSCFGIYPTENNMRYERDIVGWNSVKKRILCFKVLIWHFLWCEWT